MKRMFTTGYSRRFEKNGAIPNAGDHVIGSYIKSKDVKTVEEECEKFAVEVMKLQVQQQ